MQSSIFFVIAAGLAFLVGISLVDEIKSKTIVEVLPFVLIKYW